MFAHNFAIELKEAARFGFILWTNPSTEQPDGSTLVHIGKFLDAVFHVYCLGPADNPQAVAVQVILPGGRIAAFSDKPSQLAGRQNRGVWDQFQTLRLTIRSVPHKPSQENSAHARVFRTLLDLYVDSLH